MYNGQYAKGIVHLIVFAILVSLANENGIFLLFVFGWVFYQVIEAHHTARARRDGTVLPNPFGLNDLGERLGFGKTWPAGTPNRAYEQNQAFTPDPTTPPAAYPPPPTGYESYPPPTSSWGAPWENYVPPVPPTAPFPGVPSPDENPYYGRNRFPVGAIWLIALGALFLIGNSGIFHGYSMHWLIPILLIGFGVWQFVHKMTETGTLADDGSSLYKYRLFHALRGSVWIILIGVLFLLDNAHILSWGRSWPLFIIVAGFMAIFQRASFTEAARAPFPYSPPPPPMGSAPPSTSVVPPVSHDEEGK
jgi:hypothetical protein